MKKRLLMPMQLQFFAEPEVNEGADNPGQNQNPETDGDGKGQEQGKTFSRDEVAKMIAAEKNKARTAWEKEQEAKQEEAKKLAKMNADEKAEHERKQLEAKIAELEQRENQRGLAKEASKMLTASQVRADEMLVNLLVREDADQTKVAVNAFVEYMKEEKRQWEIERNTGSTPKRTPGNQQAITQEQFDAMPFAQKSALATKDPEQFKKLTGGY